MQVSVPQPPIAAGHEATWSLPRHLNDECRRTLPDQQGRGSRGGAAALVATAIRDEKAGTPPPQCPPELLQGANWLAARHGIGGSLVTPSGERRSAGDVLHQLMEHITPALEEAGDMREVGSLVHRPLRQGTPADRQRRALDQGLPAPIDLITTQSTAP